VRGLRGSQHPFSATSELFINDVYFYQIIIFVQFALGSFNDLGWMPILFSYQYSINDIVLCKNMEEENLA
jgi:hypothetical protein